MKKKALIQYYCPECGSINVQQKAWVGLNDSDVDWESSNDLFEYLCNDCYHRFDKIDTKVFDCHNGRVVIEGYQVVMDTNNGVEIHPEMAGSFCLYSLSQANDIILRHDTGTWRLQTCYKGDVEEPTLMYEGKDPRI